MLSVTTPSSSFGGVAHYTSTGSTGACKRFSYTRYQWATVVQYRAWILKSLGVSAGDRVAVIVPFGPWYTGDNTVDALVHLGAIALPVSLYRPHLDGAAQLMARCGFDGIVTTPSIASSLAKLSQPGRLRHLILTGEHLPQQLRTELAERYSVKPRCMFACSEAVLGYELEDKSATYSFDPAVVQLEVATEQGEFRTHGEGELTITTCGALPALHRYRNGDRVLMEPASASYPPTFRYLGRHKSAFALSGGVLVSREQLDCYLDALSGTVYEAHFDVEHRQGASDHVRITLLGSGLEGGEAVAESTFRNLTLDTADLVATGLLNVEVQIHPIQRPMAAKRKILTAERPWAL